MSRCGNTYETDLKIENDERIDPLNGVVSFKLNFERKWEDARLNYEDIIRGTRVKVVLRRVSLNFNTQMNRNRVI